MVPPAKAKILVVEDEKPLAKLLKYNLEKEGYAVVACGDGETAVALAEREKPDLVLLDIMLPKLDGLAVCRALRLRSSVPIVLLTAKRAEADRIVGLKLGADDYVVKPFSVGELAARIEAILRRASGKGAPDAAPYRAGRLEVDFGAFEVRVEGERVALTPKEFQFLKLLIEARGKVLSREDILERVWGYDRSAEIDTRTVDQHIARLRRKLGSEGARISTVTSAGYRLQPA